METEGLDFAGALEALAERAGIELEREAEDPREAERRGRRERLLALLERTAAYYVRVLWESAEAAPARGTWPERGLQEDVLREFRVGYSPRAWDRVIVASRRAGYTRRSCSRPGWRRAGATGPGCSTASAGGSCSRSPTRRATCSASARALAARRPAEVPQHVGVRALPQGLAGLRRRPRARRGGAAGRLVLVEGYTDVIALRQAGIPETVCSMGTALTDRQLDALKRLTPKVLLCQDPDAAGQEAVAKGKDAIRVFNEGHHLRGFDLRVVRLPPGEDPADVVQREGAEAMRALLETSVPVARFEVERALDAAELGTPEGRDEALRAVAPVVGAARPGPLQYDLIQLIANRLQMSEAMTEEALRARRAPTAAAAAPARAPARPSTSVDKREDTERAFLARCLAIKDAGRRALEEMDIDASFSLDLTRRAAHYLAEHLEHPGQSLPAGADDLARLVAELVIRAGDLAADPGRSRSSGSSSTRTAWTGRSPRAAAGEPVAALAAERQRVQDEIRHRLV